MPKTTPSDLRVTRLPLADLTPYPKNPRHITPAAVNAVAESLAAFGWQQPIVIDPKKVIVAGHTRCLAALQLGWTHAPTVTIAAKHARAYRLADNRSGEFSTWNLDLLGGELAALPSGQLEALPALDFDAIARKPLDGQTDPDDIPEAPKPRTKLGDVWTLGKHRLMCGDCQNEETVARLLAGAEPRVMVTDPPFGIGLDRTWMVEAAKKGKLTYAPTRVDYIESKKDLQITWEKAWSLSPSKVAYIWQMYDSLVAQAPLLDALGWQRRNLIVWGKPRPVITRGPYAHQTEYCWYAVRKNSTAQWIGPSMVSNLWSVNWEHGTLHSAQKPVELMERPISYHEGDVYEPFSGSGTTIIAAEKQGRACYAMELEPRFVDMSVARWEAFTGRTATR